jgi:transcriptional regulator with PAS, ATPase and Fis domain
MCLRGSYLRVSKIRPRAFILYSLMTTGNPRVDESGLSFELFEGLPDPMILCDESLRIVTANRAARKLLGGAHSPVGKRADEILEGRPADAGTGALHSLQQVWQSRMRTPAGARSVEVRGVRLGAGRTGVKGWALHLKTGNGAEEAPEFIGKSSVVQELLAMVAQVASGRASAVLLEGESGTGKELIARRLHALSPRAKRRQFVAINCAAIPEALLESELFGYEKGAFTDAHQQRKGLLEHACGGTLFLDEVGELPPRLQAKLLRVLEGHPFRRVGGTRDIVADMGVVGATNANLERAIKEKRFRADLYYRLNVVQIRLPALRDRLEDVPELAEYFLGRFALAHQKPVHTIHPDALRLLESYHWPGNVRQLRNVMERAVLVESSRMITVASLSIANGRQLESLGGVADRANGQSGLALSLLTAEKELLLAALDRTSWNQTQAAALLGIGRFALRHKMKKLGLKAAPAQGAGSVFSAKASV